MSRLTSLPISRRSLCMSAILFVLVCIFLILLSAQTHVNEGSPLVDPIEHVKVPSGLQPPAASASAKAEYVPDQIIVKFLPSISISKREAALRYIGAKVLRRYHSDVHMVVIGLAQGMTVDAAVSYFKKSKLIQYAEPNFIYHTNVIPNDPSFDDLWGLHNLGQNGGLDNMDINAPAAWDISIGSNNVYIGVIDTGIDYTHPDLAPNVWVNPNEIPDNGIDDDNNGYIDDIHGINAIMGSGDPMDDNSHGTHVSGTIAARGDDDVGIVGVMWQAQIISCKFLNVFGSGDTAGGLACLDYFASLADAGITVAATNNSWGGGDFSEALRDAIQLNGDKNILFVAAAGNSTTNLDQYASYPASYDLDNIISVAAHDRSGQLAYFSSYGANSVDIVAPGVDILSSVPGGGWDSYSGTSMATPHVTGMLGLIKSVAEDYAAAELKAYLLDNSIIDENFETTIRESKRAVIKLPFIDLDNDLMDDDWERLYGLDPNDPSDASGDLDADGLTNLDEFIHDSNPTQIDTDNDGLLDGDEVHVHGTSPILADTDNDGLSDKDEIEQYLTNPSLADSDADGIADGDEILTYLTNPNMADTDADGMDDGWEIEFGFNPLNNTDGTEDSDNDGLINSDEFSLGTSPISADTDQDGLSDGAEHLQYATDPLKKDSDTDGIPDGWEITYGLDPLDSADAALDTDADGFNNVIEFYADTDPNDSGSVPTSNGWVSHDANAQNNALFYIDTDAENISLRWSKAFSSIDNSYPALAKNGFVYLVSEPNYNDNKKSIVSLSSLSGDENWSSSVMLDIYDTSSLLFESEQLFIETLSLGVNSTKIRSFNAVDGVENLSIGLSDYRFENRLIGYYGYIYELDTSGVIKRNATTGAIEWQLDVDNQGYSGAALAVEGANVYHFGHDGLRIISGLSGEITATIDMPSVCVSDYYGITKLVVHGNQAVAINGTCTMVFDTTAQQLLWSKADVVTDLVILNDVIMTQTHYQVIALNSTNGDELWRWSNSNFGYLVGNLVATLNHFFVSDWDNVYAIDLTTHEQVWSYPASGLLSLTSDGALLVQSNNHVISFNIEGDSDGDGMPNWWERFYGLAINDPTDGAGDIDDDGLTNLEEFEAGTSPLLIDSDGDGLTDIDEITIYSTNPALADSDDDGLSDGEEINLYITNPTNADTDGDGINDGEEVKRYLTDPNDPQSKPEQLTSYFESFENGQPDTWISSSDSHADWMLVSNTSSDGTHSLRSGVIGASQRSAVEWTELVAAGELRFDVAVDSESCCDYLRFYIDGEQQLVVRSTEGNWASYTFGVSAGEHVFRWEYSKDSTVSFGEDAAWIDNIEFFIPPTFASNSSHVLASDGLKLYELDTDGVLIRSPLVIPNVFSASDLVITSTQKIAIVDTPQLHLFDPVAGVFETRTLNQWSEYYTTPSVLVANNVGLWTNTTASSYGLLKLTNEGEFVERVRLGNNYQDLAVDSQGTIYALRSDDYTIDVLNAETAELIESIVLPVLSRAISVSSNGDIFAIDLDGNELSRFDRSGVLLSSFSNPSDFLFGEVDTAPDGSLLIGSARSYNKYAARIANDFSDYQSFLLTTNTYSNYGATFVAAVTRGGADTDADGMPDWWEAIYGLDSSNPNDALLDNDNDQLDNLAEFTAGTNPNLTDSDDDGLSDFVEIMESLSDPLRTDTDGDGLNDGDEVNTYLTSPLFADTDSDGLTDYAEVRVYNTNPLVADSDGDSIPDGWELDYGLNPLDSADADLDLDADGLSNSEEYQLSTNPGVSDTDGDGLSDGDEYNLYATDPTLRDSDGDKMDDGWETEFGLNPLLAATYGQDSDGDGFSDLNEYYYGSNPVAAFSAPTVESWSGFAGNAHNTGYVPIVTDSANFVLRWTYELESENQYIESGIVAEFGGAYVIINEHSVDYYQKKLVKLLPAQGTLAWPEAVSIKFSGYYPNLSDSGVVLPIEGVTSSYIALFDSDTGAESSIGDVMSTYTSLNGIAVSQNLAIVGSSSFTASEDGISCIDISTGATRWFLPAEIPENWVPLIVDDHVYSFSNNSLNKINLNSGELIYSMTDPLFDELYDLASLVKGSRSSVFLLNYEQFIAIDAQTQSVKWNFNEYGLQTAAYANGMIYLSTYDELIALDEETGEELWRWSDTFSSWLTSNIIVTNNHIFVASYNQTFAISLLTHEVDWQYDGGGSLALGPDGLLYIGDSNSDQIIAVQVYGDTDADGMPDWWELIYSLDIYVDDAQTDGDSDGLSNYDEYINGTNPTLSDTDADGLSDADEVQLYGTNPAAADSDGDDLSDFDEVDIYETNPLFADSDNDGLNDGAEVNIYATDPLLSDSDSDGFTDGDEVDAGADPLDFASQPQPLTWFTLDFESTDLPNSWQMEPEANASWLLRADSTNPNTIDLTASTQVLASAQIGNGQTAAIVWADRFVEGVLAFDYRVSSEQNYDYFSFYVDDVRELSVSGQGEWLHLTIALSAGVHSLKWVYSKDYIFSSYDDRAYIDNIVYTPADKDADGMPAFWELQFGLEDLLASDAEMDNDQDDLSNLNEFMAGTNPLIADTDGDSMPDGWEIQYELDPSVDDAANDSDGDGLSNLDEYVIGTDPTDPLSQEPTPNPTSEPGVIPTPEPVSTSTPEPVSTSTPVSVGDSAKSSGGGAVNPWYMSLLLCLWFFGYYERRFPTHLKCLLVQKKL